MKNETQEKWVKEQLDEHGFITRNVCLRNYISRLGAIVYDMKKQGYEFTTEYQKTPAGGKDFIYTLIAKPNGQKRMF